MIVFQFQPVDIWLQHMQLFDKQNQIHRMLHSNGCVQMNCMDQLHSIEIHLIHDGMFTLIIRLCLRQMDSIDRISVNRPIVQTCNIL